MYHVNISYFLLNISLAIHTCSVCVCVCLSLSLNVNIIIVTALRGLLALWEYMETQLGIDPTDVWSKIKDLVIKTILR